MTAKMATAAQEKSFLDPEILLKEIEQETIAKFTPVVENMILGAIGNKNKNSVGKDESSEKVFVITNESLSALSNLVGISNNDSKKKDLSKSFFEKRLQEITEQLDILKRSSSKKYGDLTKLNRDFYTLEENFDKETVGFSDEWTVNIDNKLKSIRQEITKMAKKKILSEAELVAQLNLNLDGVDDSQVDALKAALDSATISVADEEGEDASGDTEMDDLGVGEPDTDDMSAPVEDDLAGGDDLGGDLGGSDLGGMEDEEDELPSTPPAKKEVMTGPGATGGNMTGSADLDESETVWEISDDLDESKDEDDDLDESKDEDDDLEEASEDLEEKCHDDKGDLKESKGKKGKKESAKKDKKDKKLDEIFASLDRDIAAMGSRFGAKKSAVNESVVAKQHLKEVRSLKSALNEANEKLGRVVKALLESNLEKAKYCYENALLKNYDLNTSQKKKISEAFDAAQNVEKVKFAYVQIKKALDGSRMVAEGRTVAGTVSRAGTKGGYLNENRGMNVDAMKKDFEDLQILAGIR